MKACLYSKLRGRDKSLGFVKRSFLLILNMKLKCSEISSHQRSQPWDNLDLLFYYDWKFYCDCYTSRCSCSNFCIFINNLCIYLEVF